MTASTRILVGVLACAAASAVQGQDLARRAADIRDGTIRFSFAAREGVCGDGRNNISVRSDRDTRWKDVEWECEHGPVMVALTKAGGRVTSVRTYVGARWRAPGADVVNIGVVGVREATDWLLDVAATSTDAGAEKAIFPATLADSVTVWPRLLRIARDESRPRAVRTQSVFWLGQAAGDEATKGLADVADDASGDREVRRSAVFALSQQRERGVEHLLRIARENKDKEIRKQAIFWLGQSKDPRALDYFEQVLTKK
jgi:hypothetical protein